MWTAYGLIFFGSCAHSIIALRNVAWLYACYLDMTLTDIVAMPPTFCKKTSQTPLARTMLFDFMTKHNFSTFTMNFHLFVHQAFLICFISFALDLSIWFSRHLFSCTVTKNQATKHHHRLLFPLLWRCRRQLKFRNEIIWFVFYIFHLTDSKTHNISQNTNFIVFVRCLWMWASERAKEQVCFGFIFDPWRFRLVVCLVCVLCLLHFSCCCVLVKPFSYITFFIH